MEEGSSQCCREACSPTQTILSITKASRVARGRVGNTVGLGTGRYSLQVARGGEDEKEKLSNLGRNHHELKLLEIYLWSGI